MPFFFRRSVSSDIFVGDMPVTSLIAAMVTFGSLSIRDTITSSSVATPPSSGLVNPSVVLTVGGSVSSDILKSKSVPASLASLIAFIPKPVRSTYPIIASILAIRELRGSDIPPWTALLRGTLISPGFRISRIYDRSRS